MCEWKYSMFEMFIMTLIDTLHSMW